MDKKGFDAVVHSFKLTDLDKLVAIHVLNKEKDLVDGDVEIGIEEPFGEVRSFQPTRNMKDAMEAAKAINLFHSHALHFGIGAYSQEESWFVSRIDERGVLQGFVAAKVDTMAVILACLEKAGVSVDPELLKFAKEVSF